MFVWGGGGGGAGWEVSFILLSRFQVRQSEADEDPGAAALRLEVDRLTLVKQSGTLVRGELDPRQTQPETPCSTWQLLDERRERQYEHKDALLRALRKGFGKDKWIRSQAEFSTNVQSCVYSNTLSDEDKRQQETFEDKLLELHFCYLFHLDSPHNQNREKINQILGSESPCWFVFFCFVFVKIVFFFPLVCLLLRCQHLRLPHKCDFQLSVCAAAHRLLTRRLPLMYWVSCSTNLERGWMKRWVLKITSLPGCLETVFAK